MQAIKEDFNKEVLSILGEILGKTMSCVSHPTKIRRRKSGQMIQGYCWIE
jgi:hypothetical protein